MIGPVQSRRPFMGHICHPICVLPSDAFIVAQDNFLLKKCNYDDNDDDDDETTLHWNWLQVSDAAWPREWKKVPGRLIGVFPGFKGFLFSRVSYSSW